MPIHVGVNGVKASLVGGEPLVTLQPENSLTTVIAVNGSYGTDPSAPARSDLHDNFLALLSIDNSSIAPSRNTNETDEDVDRRQRREHHGLREAHALTECRQFGMFKGILDERTAAQHRTNRAFGFDKSDEYRFCDDMCRHQPGQSLFPGNPAWDLASGEASFDRARGEGRPRPQTDDVAPDETAGLFALRALRDMVRRAVDAGLRDLTVGISATVVPEDTVHAWADMVRMAVLVEQVAEEVERWTTRDRIQVTLRWEEVRRDFVSFGPRSFKPFGVRDVDTRDAAQLEIF